MSAPIASAPLPGDVSLEILLPNVFDVSLTGIQLLRPLYAPGNTTPVDFAFAYTNPAGLRMIGVTPPPNGSLVAQFPHTLAAGVLAYYQQVFTSGEESVYEVNYQADGIDNYFRFRARRSGDYLLVSFTDTSDQPRSAVEEALRQSQAREQDARAEAERQRGELQRLFAQAPVAMALFRGPAYVIELANESMAGIWGRPLSQVLGQPVFTALPYIQQQGFEAIFAEVLTQGTPYDLYEAPVTLDCSPGDEPARGYFNLTYRPQRDAQGQITGIITSAHDVTEQVLARQQAEQLKQELEARILARTQEAQTALGTAERERNLLQAVLTQAPVAISLFQGEEMRITEANAQMAALWGRTPEQVLGQPFMEAVPELRGQGFDDLLRQVLHTRVPFIGTETPADVLRGEQVQTTYYNFVYQPLYDAEGQLLGIMDVAVEVTEQVLARRQVEQLNQELEARVLERTEQLREAQAAAERERAQLQSLLTQAPVAISLFEGDDLRVALANPLITKLWGYPPEQVLGRPLLEAVPELQGQGFDDLLRQVLHTRVPFRGKETPAQLRSDDQLLTIYFNFVYQPLYDAQGQVAGVINVAVDVTEQVLARQQVEQLNQELEARVLARTQEAQTARQLAEVQKQRLEQLFLQAPAAICILDGPDLVFELVNPAYQQLFAGRALLGLPLLAALPELTAQPVWHTLQQVYRTGITHQDLGLRVPLARTAGGPLEYVYFNYIFQPRTNVDGQVDGLVVFCFDVTEQVLARQQVQALNEELATINGALTATNAELHASNQQLTRTNVDLDTFVYTASHDLKAPITNIESIALALRSALPPAVQQDELVAHLLDLLGQTVARFQFTIGQLTDLSKLQLAHAGPAEPVELAAVIEAVRLDLAPVIVAAEARLTVEVAPALLVSFSPANLRSIVYNLLSNALKYRAADRPARIMVRATPAGQQVTLEVQDNGLGLNAHQQSRLFGLFQRLHTHVDGTGVGLYITKRLVENGGGTITVASQVDVGTTFTLTFPA